MDLKTQNLLKTVFDTDLFNEINKAGVLMKFEAGTMVLDTGSHINMIPIVLEGTLRVLREDEKGQELFLYYVKPLESCAMTLSAFLQNKKSHINAISEEPTTLLLLPVENINPWMNLFTSWKKFVFQTFHKRFDEMLEVLDNVAFRKIDERLHRYLKENGNVASNNVLNISHQQIANELNASREMISRLLKQLERKGKIKLRRNKIEIIDLM